MIRILALIFIAFLTVAASGQTDIEKRNAFRFFRDIGTIGKTLAPADDKTYSQALDLWRDDYKSFCAIAAHWNTKAKVHLKDFIDAEVSKASYDQKSGERAFKEIDSAIRSYYWDNWKSIGSMIQGRLR